MGRRPGVPTVRLDDEHGEIYQYAFTAHGTRHRGSTGRRDYEEALAEAQRLYGQALLGKRPDRRVRVQRRQAASAELTALFAEFISSIEGKRAKNYTDKMESHFRAHFAERWATVDDMIAPGAIDKYASDRLAGKAPAVEDKPKRPRPAKGTSVTVAKELVTIRRFLKWCKARGVIDELPAIEAVKPVTDYQPPDYSEDDVRRLLAALPDRHSHRRGFAAREFFTVQWAQGFRPDVELGTLRWGDVNMRRREMTVRQANDKARQGRVIAMAPETYDVLKAMSADGQPLPSALVFGRRNFRRSLELAAEACGLPRPTRHNLRHFRLTELGHSPGTAPAALQFFAGHKHMATTDKYIRGRTRATRDMLDALNRKGSGS